jgi:hypothetical protein
LGRQEEGSLDLRVHDELRLDEARAPGKPEKRPREGGQKIQRIEIKRLKADLYLDLFGFITAYLDL